MASTEICKRFPSHQGFATRQDIPTFTDLTSYALCAHMNGLVNDHKLAAMLTAFRLYSDNDHWAAITMRDRALLMTDGMGYQADLIRVEASIRQS